MLLEYKSNYITLSFQSLSLSQLLCFIFQIISVRKNILPEILLSLFPVSKKNEQTKSQGLSQAENLLGPLLY